MKTVIRLIASLIAAGAFAGATHAQNVRILGRAEQAPTGGFAIQWPSSGFEATFDGATLSAQIYDWGSNWLNVEIDGKLTVLALEEGLQRYDLFKGEPGQHTVRVTRRTGTPVGVTRIDAVESDGKVLPTQAPDRRILVIGDDLASGYGVEGANETCVYSYQTQNSDLGYPALLAKTFGADVHVVAADGRGLIRNYSDAGPAMDVLAWQSLVDGDRAWAALSYQPQVIVVGLGTADFTQSDPGAPFDEAYFLLLRKLRVAYPDAVIMASVGGALWGKRYLAARDSIAEAVEAVRKTGDSKVRFTEFKLTAGPGRYGCDYHPGKLAQVEMAAALKAEIEAALGWKSHSGAAHHP